MMKMKVDVRHVGRELGRGAYAAVFAMKTPGIVVKVCFDDEDNYHDYIDWLIDNDVNSSARPVMFPCKSTQKLARFALKEWRTMFKGDDTGEFDDLDVHENMDDGPRAYVGERLMDGYSLFKKDPRKLERLVCLLQINSCFDPNPTAKRQLTRLCNEFKILNQDAVLRLLRKLEREDLLTDLNGGNVMFRKVSGGWELVVTDPAC